MKPAIIIGLKAVIAFIIGYITFIIICVAAASLWLIRNGYTTNQRHGRALTTPPPS